MDPRKVDISSAPSREQLRFQVSDLGSHKHMYLAYSLLLTLGLLVLIPHFIYQAIAHGKYVDGLSQRSVA